MKIQIFNANKEKMQITFFYLKEVGKIREYKDPFGRVHCDCWVKKSCIDKLKQWYPVKKNNTQYQLDYKDVIY